MNNEFFSENDQSSDQPISLIGTRLKTAREKLGLTITDVARQLRLADDRIEALENNNYQNMPGVTFVKGYLRGYARLLNLPADEIILDFERLNLFPETKSFVLSSQKQPVLFSNKPARWMIYSTAVALLILLLAWWNSAGNSDPANSNMVNSPAMLNKSAKNVPSGTPFTNVAPASGSTDAPKNPDNAASSTSEAGKASVQGTEANGTQLQRVASTAPPPSVSPTETKPSKTAAETRVTPTHDTTEQDTNDEVTSHKKKASTSHTRVQFAEPFDDE